MSTSIPTRDNQWPNDFCPLMYLPLTDVVTLPRRADDPDGPRAAPTVDLTRSLSRTYESAPIVSATEKRVKRHMRTAHRSASTGRGRRPTERSDRSPRGR